MLTAAEVLTEVDDALGQFRLDAQSLVADLVLFGLALEVQAQCNAALTLAGSVDPFCGLANARVAFASAQQAVVLATQSEYAGIGVTMWIYFARNDRELGAMSTFHPLVHDLYESRAAALRQAVQELDPHRADQLVAAEDSVDRLPNHPDYWLGRSMAAAYETGLAKITADLGATAPNRLREIEAAAYKALCLGTHARLH